MVLKGFDQNVPKVSVFFSSRILVRVESEGRGDKIAVLRLVCFFGSSMYPDDETSSFFP